jgi:hypothetical protein
MNSSSIIHQERIQTGDLPSSSTNSHTADQYSCCCFILFVRQKRRMHHLGFTKQLQHNQFSHSSTFIYCLVARNRIGTVAPEEDFSDLPRSVVVVVVVVVIHRLSTSVIYQGVLLLLLLLLLSSTASQNILPQQRL